ncbi:MAG TPA: TraR/DksA C4-type zinc finger protein [Acidimicrobiales bacterium]|nr:TraR/DksA C4-type zinc finger protein [Acidimicrobiales bacterium]
MTKTTKAGVAGSTTKTTAPTNSGKDTERTVKAKSAGPGASAAGAAKASKPADRFVEAQRKQLLAEREAYTKSATTLRAEADQLAQDREPGDVQFDEESGQGDSMNVERERDLALSAQALASVEEIDVALERIDKGTYGICERCGQPIPKERLKALPSASLCVRCKSGGLSRR